MGLKNVLLVVKDLETSKRFYKELFGLDVVSDAGSTVILTEGLVLQEQAAWESGWQQKAEKSAPTSILYFEEYDMCVFLKRLNDSGFNTEYVTDVSENKENQRNATLFDPDGHVIEVAEVERKNCDTSDGRCMGGTGGHVEHVPHDFEELLDIVSDLRGPEGCEWDKAQTHETLKKCLTDETEEVLQAIDNKDDENLCEELGDVLLQVVMNAQVAKERGAFDIGDVIQGLCDKLIRRHPHVFGDVDKPKNPEEALELWRMVKQKEKEVKNEK